MIRRKLAQFMTGRYGSYGVDKLGWAIILFAFILFFVSLFFRSGLVAYILYGIHTALYVYFVFRLLSRNIAARQKENRAFLGLRQKVKDRFRLTRDRIRDRKDYRYKKCPSCKVILRLPAKKGEHTVKCPKCGQRFKVNNVF